MRKVVEAVLRLSILEELEVLGVQGEAGIMEAMEAQAPETFLVEAVVPAVLGVLVEMEAHLLEVVGEVVEGPMVVEGMVMVVLLSMAQQVETQFQLVIKPALQAV